MQHNTHTTAAVNIFVYKRYFASLRCFVSLFSFNFFFFFSYFFSVRSLTVSMWWVSEWVNERVCAVQVDSNNNLVAGSRQQSSNRFSFYRNTHLIFHANDAKKPKNTKFVFLQFSSNKNNSDQTTEDRMLSLQLNSKWKHSGVAYMQRDRSKESESKRASERNEQQELLCSLARFIYTHSAVATSLPPLNSQTSQCSVVCIHNNRR